MTDLSRFRHEHTVTIAAPPDAVYAVVADITRMGELSPVCTGGEWVEEGRTFTGHNAIGEFTWSTRCRVEVAEPGREFAFVNTGANGDVDLVRWGYRFDPVDGGAATEVTETWQVLPDYAGFVKGDDPELDVEARVEGMAVMAREGMAATLQRLKEIVES